MLELIEPEEAGPERAEQAEQQAKRAQYRTEQRAGQAKDERTAAQVLADKAIAQLADRPWIRMLGFSTQGVPRT